MTRLVVVGASLAGTHAANAIRRAGFDDELVMVGEEPHLPYDRPPLSKNYLVDDEVDEKRLQLRPTVDPDQLGLVWRLGRRAVGLSVQDHYVELDDGDRVEYDGLVIATGSRPRRIPQVPAATGLFELRTLDDARALRRAFEAKPDRVVVCGAGFIGAEVAASARQRDIPVTMVEMASAPLDRVLPREAGMAIADLHRANDVDVRLGVGVVSVETIDDGPGAPRVRAVRLNDGQEIEAEVVVVGIGVVPNSDWLEGSGLTIDNGVVTDASCLAAPKIVAAGDVARWPNGRFGGALMRVEQWDNAVEMGAYAGRTLLGEINGEKAAESFEPVPWFWSDQYDCKIQLAGLVSEHVEVVQGGIGEERFVQIYFDAQERLQGALCWNRPRHAIKARQLVAAGQSAATARLELS